jgi:hypothetical protein
MQHAAVLAQLGEAYVLADRLHDAATSAERALTLARERGQRGDEATALYVLGEAAARDPIDPGKAEQYYAAAIALAGELEMRPLLARSHLGLGRLYVRASDPHRAEDHLLTAMRLFIAMDMPHWLRQTAASLSELGRVLVVAHDHRALYEYLSSAVPPTGPVRVVFAAPGRQPTTDDEGRRSHAAAMLQAHGLTITEH